MLKRGNPYRDPVKFRWYRCGEHAVKRRVINVHDIKIDIAWRLYNGQMSGAHNPSRNRSASIRRSIARRGPPNQQVKVHCRPLIPMRDHREAADDHKGQRRLLDAGL